ncbi:unnamed protein product [Leptidea sinapis]|uniref:E3 ubiquitin-protein ligase n=1 Tax=Leptidea sinapis TaxID=189913 RepID=A0A5E4Q9R0_9NEOP|nr:unnamed protein product [Leptidea sinapis]
MTMKKGRIVMCRKCRHILLDNFETSYHKSTSCLDSCSSYNLQTHIHLDEAIPQWIKSKVEETGWTKGKLKCSECGSKVGSFDYVSGRKCECDNTVLPPIHFIKSQVDIPMELVV